MKTWDQKQHSAVFSFNWILQSIDILTVFFFVCCRFWHLINDFWIPVGLSIPHKLRKKKELFLLPIHYRSFLRYIFIWSFLNLNISKKKSFIISIEICWVLKGLKTSVRLQISFITINMKLLLVRGDSALRRGGMGWGTYFGWQRIVYWWRAVTFIL